jgi:UDP-glucose 4-epimerase
VREGRRCWLLGGGDVRHQTIYADDLIAACLAAVELRGSHTFNIGSDNVPTIREMYERLCAHANTGARVASLPQALALRGMQLAHKLGLSPLGPYQFRMLTEDFVFDTAKIKRELDWRPTLDNAGMLIKAYDYYVQHRAALLAATDISANRQPIAKLGMVGLLKMIS